MLKYITIPLSSSSTTYCHYSVMDDGENIPISSVMLSKIIRWCMKENLSIQFLFPATPIPRDLENIIESIDHVKIVPETVSDVKLLDKADIIVSGDSETERKIPDKIYVIRTNFSSIINSAENLKNLIRLSRKVNVVFTDVPEFSKDDIDRYRSFLEDLAGFISNEYLNGNLPQFNLITDRMMLTEMNNCNAGHESIAVSADGIFYPCAAFIGNPDFSCGNIDEGLNIPNPQLYRRENAPICKICDAYNCKRCVWLNHSLTHEVNTPGWQQCHMAHLEREAARNVLETIRKVSPSFLGGIAISELEYLDPFTQIEKL